MRLGKHRVRRRRSATAPGIVHDVVVEQGEGVHQLQRGWIGRAAKIVCQRPFHHRGCRRFVDCTRVGSRDGRQHREPFDVRGEPQLFFERLCRIGNASQGDQNLQHKPVSLARIGYPFGPGFGGLQCRVTGARLQRNFRGALVKLRASGFPGGVQHQREPLGRLAFLGGDLAHQQLVEKLAVQG